MEKKKGKTLVQQGLILVVASVLVRIFGFLYRIPLTAMIGDEGNAIYSASFNIYTFFILISSAAMPAVIGKLISERNAKGEYGNSHKVFRYALLISTTMGFLSMCLLFFGASWFEEFSRAEGSVYSIKVLSPTVFVVSILAVYRGYFQGMKNTVPTAISQVLEQMINAIVSVVAAYILVQVSVAHGAAGGTIGTFAGATTGFLVITIIYLRHRKAIVERAKLYPVDESGFKITSEIVKTAFPIIIGTTIFSITNIIDMRMSLGRLMDIGYTEHDALALYGQLAGKYTVITNLPISIATAFATVMIPNLAEMRVKKDNKKLKESINLAVKVVMIITIPASIGVGILSDEILMFLYPAYPEGGKLLLFGAINIIIVSYNQILTGILQGSGRMYLPIISAIFGIVIKIVTNYVLIGIPSINILGAVFGTMLCYTVLSTLNYRFVVKQVNVRIDFKFAIIQPLIAGIVMGVIVFCVNYGLFAITNSNNISLLISIFIGIAVYFIMLIKIGALTEDDLTKIPKGNRLLKLLKKINLI